MDNSKLLALDGQYICDGNIDQIRISLSDQLYKLGLLWRVKPYPQLWIPTEETNHLILIHPVWWQFGELELIDLDGEKTLVRFYQPEIPDLQDILDHESAIRKFLSRPALVWFLDNLELGGKVIEILGQELLDHRLACLEGTQNRLVSSMGLNQYPLSYFELRSAPEVGISQTEPEVHPEMENRKDIPTDQISIRQDTPLRGEDLELLRLWQGGLTAKEIGQRTGKTGKTIQNRLTALRKIQGEEKVPLRKKDDRGISWDKSG